MSDLFKPPSAPLTPDQQRAVWRRLWDWKQGVSIREHYLIYLKRYLMGLTLVCIALSFYRGSEHRELIMLGLGLLVGGWLHELSMLVHMRRLWPAVAEVIRWDAVRDSLKEEDAPAPTPPPDGSGG